MSRTAALSPDPVRLPARERLLAAAEALFYDEGINAVGIDRIIERAGVAKASLYDCFGSKEELVRSYLAVRHAARKARLEAAMARHDHPREKLLSLFDGLARTFRDAGFRGCAFANASAEARPGSTVETVCETARQWMRGVLVGLAKDLGVADPKRLAQQLMIVYDGASISARMDHDAGAAAAARSVAVAMIDAAAKTRDA